MIAADRPGRAVGQAPRAVDARTAASATCRAPRWRSLFGRGDLVVANDAATLPASLHGTHLPSGDADRDPARRLAVARAIRPRFSPSPSAPATTARAPRTAPPPPPLAPGDRLAFGPLTAAIERCSATLACVELRFVGSRPRSTGRRSPARPADPVRPRPRAAGARGRCGRRSPPTRWRSRRRRPASRSTGARCGWRGRGVGFATLTHAAGISSTGDPALDRRLPFDEPYRIPQATAAAIAETKRRSGRVIAIGTTVVRALEAAADAGRRVRAGQGVARGRIGPDTRIASSTPILTGIHQPGESHFELLRAFADDATARPHHHGALRAPLSRPRFGEFLVPHRAHARVRRGRSGEFDPRFARTTLHRRFAFDDISASAHPAVDLQGRGRSLSLNKRPVAGTFSGGGNVASISS